MTNFNEKRYYNVLRYLNENVKGFHVDYMNMCIASGFAQGKESKMNSDWLRRFLLGQVEDEFIGYEDALKFAEQYRPLIENAKNNF